MRRITPGPPPHHTPEGKISTLGQQFMPITQLRGLKANDFASDQYTPSHIDRRFSMTGELPEHRDITVGELSRDHPVYQYHAKGNRFDWDRLSRDVADQGIQHPFHVSSELPGQVTHDPAQRLINGHHRAIIAMEQGHMFVPVSPNPPGNGPGNASNEGYRKIQPEQPSMKWGPLMPEEPPATTPKPAAPMIDQLQGQLFNGKQFK